MKSTDPKISMEKKLANLVLILIFSKLHQWMLLIFSQLEPEIQIFSWPIR